MSIDENAFENAVKKNYVPNLKRLPCSEGDLYRFIVDYEAAKSPITDAQKSAQKHGILNGGRTWLKKFYWASEAKNV